MNISFKGEVDRNAAYFVLPIAFELQRDPVTGTVICGDETAAACKAAVSIAHNIRNRGGCANVYVTAGHAGNGWDVDMCEVMKGFITAQMGMKMWSSELPNVIASPAPTFNTEGEIRKLVSIISEQLIKRRPHIIVVGKDWHMWRVRMILWFIGREMAGARKYMPHWTIVTIPSNVPYRHRMREFAAIPANFLRMFFRNARSQE